MYVCIVYFHLVLVTIKSLGIDEFKKSTMDENIDTINSLTGAKYTRA